MAETGRYLYAITRGVDAAALADVRGLAGSAVEAVPHRGLVAVVSTVDLDEYGEEGLRRNLERLDWLEEVARAHDAVVQAVALLGPTAPLRLATICLDDQGVRDRLETSYDALSAALDRVEGRREWSVKGLAAARAAAPAAAPATGAEGGAAYLMRKKAETTARQADENAATRAAEEVHEQLRGISVAARLLAPQDPRLTGHQGTMLLNAAYLVEEGDGEAFANRVAELASAHPVLQLDVQGPWPPYSFATLEQA
jgi:hypothetical protein